jgi:hypothetical protein
LHAAQHWNARHVMMYWSEKKRIDSTADGKAIRYEWRRCSWGSFAVLRPVAFMKIRQRTAQEPQTDYDYEQDYDYEFWIGCPNVGLKKYIGSPPLRIETKKASRGGSLRSAADQ